MYFSIQFMKPLKTFEWELSDIISNADEHSQCSSVLLSCNLNQTICSYREFFSNVFIITASLTAVEHGGFVQLGRSSLLTIFHKLWSLERSIICGGCSCGLLKREKNNCKSPHKTALITETSCDLRQICGHERAAGGRLTRGIHCFDSCDTWKQRGVAADLTNHMFFYANINHFTQKVHIHIFIYQHDFFVCVVSWVTFINFLG